MSSYPNRDAVLTLAETDGWSGVSDEYGASAIEREISHLNNKLTRLRSAAILAARSSPEDIRKAGWLLVRHDDFASGSLHKVMWVFVPVEPSDDRWIEGIGPTDADALDSVRKQLNLPIPGETT